MLVAFTFRAKPGKEAEFERLLNDPAAGRLVAKLTGATRNTLFLGRGRMVRVLEFPDGAKPSSIADAAQANPDVAAFLRRLGPLIEDGFDPDDRRSLDAFNQRAMVPFAYDVRP